PLEEAAPRPALIASAGSEAGRWSPPQGGRTCSAGTGPIAFRVPTPYNKYVAGSPGASRPLHLHGPMPFMNWKLSSCIQDGQPAHGLPVVGHVGNTRTLCVITLMDSLYAGGHGDLP